MMMTPASWRNTSNHDEAQELMVLVIIMEAMTEHWSSRCLVTEMAAVSWRYTGEGCGSVCLVNGCSCLEVRRS